MKNGENKLKEVEECENIQSKLNIIMHPLLAACIMV